MFVYTGMPSAGKGVVLNLEIMRLLERNKKAAPRLGYLRPVYTNVEMSKSVKAQYGNGLQFFELFDVEKYATFENCDVVIDEMATPFDSQHWDELPRSVKHWLRIHKHLGVEIYGAAQDFTTVDANVRRLTDHLYRVFKVVGSRRPTPMNPRVKRVWGLIVVREVDQSTKGEEASKYAYTHGIFLSRYIWLTRAKVRTYNTLQKFDGKILYAPLRHIERHCEECGKNHVKHV